MWWHHRWPGAHGRARRFQFRPLVQTLEDRTLPSFLPAVSYPVGSEPSAVAVGDFNGDGALDLAVANEGSGTVSILLANGDGSFQPAQDFTAWPNPSSLAVGDFNGDGILDLAVTNAGAQGTVSILLGNGDGSFQGPVSYAAGPYPGSLAVGDFNGDGAPDLVVVNGNNSRVSVLLGNGDGSFQDLVNTYGIALAYTLAVGDFNGDGAPDLAVAGNFYLQGVSILLGAGDGTFVHGQGTGDGQGFHASVTVGDFNGDGLADLALADSVGTTVGILLGQGDGTFRHVTPSASAGPFPRSLAVGDFNGDGRQDLVVANGYNADTVSVLLGNGDGSFQARLRYDVGSYPASVAVGDFNGDGFPDIVVANYDADAVSVLLNAADWAGPPAPQSGTRSLAPHATDPSQGLPDLVSAHPTSPGTPAVAARPPLTAPQLPTLWAGALDGSYSGAPRVHASPFPVPVAQEAPGWGWLSLEAGWRVALADPFVR
jgi:hypothetical protein